MKRSQIIKGVFLQLLNTNVINQYLSPHVHYTFISGAECNKV